MATVSLEDRVAALEAEVATLRAKLEKGPTPEVPWWKEWVGAFRGDPLYEEAMRIGSKWRESQRPKPRKKKAKKSK